MDKEEKEQLQEQIDKLQSKLDELNNESELEAGWYYATCLGTKCYLCYFNDPKSELTSECWFSPSSNSFIDGIGSFSKIERKAKDEEVEAALIKEAKRRGLKDGVIAKNLWVTDDNYAIKGYYYNIRENVLYGAKESCGGSAIFKDGKWAEIIEQPKVTINGYDMEVDGNEVKFGCAKFRKHQITDIYRNIFSFNSHSKSNRKITSIKLDSGVEITLEQLKQINDELNKN